MVTADQPLTLLLVHGFLDDARVWDGVTAALTSPGPTTVAVDLAGMSGRPDEPGPITLERYAADVVSALDATDGPVVVVGQSMGAQIAELVGVARPERVAGLVLLTPIPLGGSGLPAEAIEPFRALGGNAEQQRGVRLQLSASFPEGELERLVEAGARVAPDAVAAAADSWNDGVPDAPASSSFAGPVLIVRGAADPFVSDELVAAAVSPRFARSEVAAVPGAGHWAHVEQPAAVAALLDAFLAELRPGANTSAGVRPQGWTTAFADKSATSFADALAAEVELHASVLFTPVVGREAVQTVMAAASTIYESLVFTQESTTGRRSYLEWEATAFGGVALQGVTVLTKNEDERIVHVAIHHRPLRAALTFSRALGEKLAGDVEGEHFYGADQPL
ncbi:alpha/beta hydrolase [Pseudonocardia xishanensis]|uniref:AB hydrolase-1 domain-containing protein n=1 Tax=Pseudonocardia xishanensis TaxID=630995 RepID=A0ABP8RHU5_9PSEU